MGQPVVECHNLIVRRAGATALDHLQFTLRGAQTIGLLGPSGSGKTTLLRSIMGLQRITSGTVNVFGLSAGNTRLRRRIGYMPQNASIYDDLTVRQNLQYFARVQGAQRGSVERALEHVNLTAEQNQLVRTLSGGQSKRVSLAIAMLHSPHLLILDEPTVGLDPVLRAELWRLFDSLAHDGVTLVVSSHVMDEASRCDEVILLRGGKLIVQTRPEEFLRNTGATTLEAAFLHAITGRA